MKKLRLRRQWIHSINAAVREHGFNYSRFQFGLTRSNIELDRKILSDLAVSEPFSFKSVVDEIDKQMDVKALMKQAPRYVTMKGMNY